MSQFVIAFVGVGARVALIILNPPRASSTTRVARGGAGWRGGGAPFDRGGGGPPANLWFPPLVSQVVISRLWVFTGGHRLLWLTIPPLAWRGVTRGRGKFAQFGAI